jgi:hypothetical protein
MKRASWIVLLLTCCLAPLPARGEAYHVIVCGSGGEEVYSARFADWGNRLRTVLLAYSGEDPARVALLLEAPAEGAQQSTLENIRAVFQGLVQACGPDDEVFVYLIGHGSHRAGVSKFNVPGPDLSAEELGALLDALPTRRTCLVNGSSTSAGFINVLSAPERIVCTATRDTEERNATRFMGAFVEALEDETADIDRDGRISVLEACTQAAVLTAAAYEGDGLLQTEHAILDDNADRLGTRLPVEVAQAAEGPMDGNDAAARFLKDHRFPPHVPQELIDEYRNALASVEELKQQKAALSEEDYYARLEPLLLKAARANRAIRQAAEQPAAAAAPVPENAPTEGEQCAPPEANQHPPADVPRAGL